MKRTLEDLIEELKNHNVSEKILEAMKIIKREIFVLNKEEAYLNEALPFYSQTTSQPLVIANIIESLELTKKDIVLEFGTGSGYQTCLIAYFANKVYSFEIDEQIFLAAKKNITKCKEELNSKYIKLNIELIKANIFKSENYIKEIASKHKNLKAIFSFAINNIPSFIIQNVELVIAPIEYGQKYQKLKKIKKINNELIVQDLGYVSFVKARNQNEH